MRTESSACAAVVASLGVVLGGCAAAPVDRIPQTSACTGVPGDLRNPTAPNADSAPTHGPGGSGVAIQRAIDPARREDLDVAADAIPMLYVYDDAGRFALDSIRRHDALSAPIFEDLGKSAFWLEIVDTSAYSIPEFDTCMQSRLLGDDFVFRAPPGGLLFVQYRKPDCEPCDRVDNAIAEVTAADPARPIRWVQVDVSVPEHVWCVRNFNLVADNDRMAKLSTGCKGTAH